MSKKEIIGTVVGTLLLTALFLALITCIFGCGGTPDLPPCGPGTYEFRGICLPTETEPPCGPGTYEVSGVCVADPVTPPPPVKTLVCGPGTLEIAGKCIPDEIPTAQFIKAEVVVSPNDSATITASYELTLAARVYYKFRYDLNKPWLVWATDTQKATKSSLGFSPIAPNTTVFWRMEARNDDDKVDDTREGMVQTPPVSTLTISAASDTPSSQTLVMGTTGVELLRFKLQFYSQEDAITIDTLTIIDDTTSAAAGSLKNFKLMNGEVAYGNPISALNNKNIQIGATFTVKSTLKVIKDNYYALLFNIKADITTWDDGGTVSSHRLHVTGATATTKSGAKVAVKIAAGADEPVGNWMAIRRTNLTVAVAPDSPSGPQVPVAEQVVAKFVLSNGSNVGNYHAIITYLKVTVNQKGVFPKNGALRLRAYHDSLSASNVVLDSTNVYAGTIAYSIYTITPIMMGIPAGSSRSLIITLDTANAAFNPNNGLQIELQTDGIGWNDGVGFYNTVDSLPVSGGTLTF